MISLVILNEKKKQPTKPLPNKNVDLMDCIFLEFLFTMFNKWLLFLKNMWPCIWSFHFEVTPKDCYKREKGFHLLELFIMLPVPFSWIHWKHTGSNFGFIYSSASYLIYKTLFISLIFSSRCQKVFILQLIVEQTVTQTLLHIVEICPKESQKKEKCGFFLLQIFSSFAFHSKLLH